ncbi:SH3 domain-containing protein [Caloramator quimbayensis]|uniref:N-acetylmuramoyl-L-alanine amidase n=1 Tax=Caloramator quimbayensis TaxID=1147123 RepID=A0A1T4YBZ9_9CLOT|nr:N-acetylmuramoyl-L-alanine amidase [Caloramator quimbayensis]SKA99299.1 SH3 domain-containing protein [Caloramator quimbayensis]
MLSINQVLLTSKLNRPGRNIKKLKGVVMHYTADTHKGADADAIARYFNTNTRGASAHYIVDDHQIIQCIPDNEVAWHVGANKYTAIGQRIQERPYGPNYFLIGIEMCVNSDGDWGRTYINAVQLAAYLLKKHGLTVKDLYRHYDITGKNCPAMMIDQAVWSKFKTDVEVTMLPPAPQQQYKKGEVIATTLNCREKPSTSAKINGKLQKGAVVTIYDQQGDWYLVNNKTPQWVCRDYVKII